MRNSCKERFEFPAWLRSIVSSNIFVLRRKRKKEENKNIGENSEGSGPICCFISELHITK